MILVLSLLATILMCSAGRDAWTLQATQMLSPTPFSSWKSGIFIFNTTGVVTQGTYAGLDASFKF